MPKHKPGGSRPRYFFLEELSDFFVLSDFAVSALDGLSALPESSDCGLASLPETESPFEEDEAEPVEDFLA